MKIWRCSVLFYLGGMLYCGIELAWRRRTHGSMFLLGGLCFMVLGELGHKLCRLPLIFRGVMVAGVITVLELLWGLAVNQAYEVWDYRKLPMNFRGQICLPFFVAWMPLGLLAMWLYRKADEWIKRIS